MGSRGQKWECRRSGGNKDGGRRTDNEHRTKRKRKGGEWEERTALFDINSHVI